jgi:hypothetical protein
MYALTGDEWEPHFDSWLFWEPQCTVTTKRGTRCLHRIFSGQVVMFDEHDNPCITQADADKFHAGICPFHLKLASK